MEIPLFIDHTNPPREGKKEVARDTVQCIVKHPTEDKFICLKWKKYNWQTFIIGGIEEGETAEDAGIREIKEETGYQNIKFIRQLGGIVHSKYFATHKDENRLAIVRGLYFVLENEERKIVDEKEQENFEVVWISKEEVPNFVRGAEVGELWRRLVAGE